MRVDTMRQIDYWAGVPLCFLATQLVRVGRLLGLGRRVPAQPENALFIELSEMGSAILVDPAMRKLRDSGAKLHFAIFSGNAASLRLLGTVAEEDVFTIRDTGLFTLAWDTLRFAAWCRKRRIDTTIDLELFSRFTALLTALSGAARRVGYYRFHNEGLYRGELLTHRVAYNPHQHIARNFVALVNSALAEREELPYSKTLIGDDEVRLAKAKVTPAQREAMVARVRESCADYDPANHRLFLVNPNASDLLPQRRWMPEHFAEVIRGVLGGHSDVLVLLTGAPAERKQAEALRVAVGDERCINFAGRVKFAELPALYQIAALMLTNDSGPGHFSAVTDMPTFVIFGPETPALYGSLGNSTPIYAGLACSPCVSASNHRKTPCVDNVCLKVITPERVLATIEPVLTEV